MLLITFEDIENANIVAAQKQFKIKDNPLNFSESPEQLATIPESFLVLGHSAVDTQNYLFMKKKRDTVGDQSAEELANKLKQVVPEKDRKKVKDIYLYACEAGWNHQPNKPCFAAQLAHQLHLAGFEHIKVHAITNPQPHELKHTSMRVELILKERRGVGVPTAQVGDGSAYLCNEAGEEKVVFMDSAHLKAELDRPENTFIGAEQLNQINAKEKHLPHELRRVTVNKNVLFRPVKPSAELLQDDKYIDVIDALLKIQALNPDLDINKLIKEINSNPTQWQQIFFDKMDNYHKHNISHNRHNSTLYELLFHFVTTYNLTRTDGLNEFLQPMKQVLGNVDNLTVNSSGKETLTFTFTYTTPKGRFEVEVNKDKLAPVANDLQKTLKPKKVNVAKQKIKFPPAEPETVAAVKAESAIAPRPIPHVDNKAPARPTSPSPAAPKTHKLKDVVEYYKYSNSPRGLHFWYQARVKNKAAANSAHLKTLQGEKGDTLKGSILRHLKTQLEACSNKGELAQCVDKLKTTEEYKILNTSQGVFTWMFQLFVRTDSVKAFDRMVEDQQHHFKI